MKKLLGNKKTSIFAILIIVLLTISTLALLSDSNLTPINTVNAQTTSSVPSNLLQYEWLGIQATTNENHFTNSPAPSSPDVLWQDAFTTAPGRGTAAFNGMLFITQGSNITALDPETGKIIYTVAVPSPVSNRTSTAAYIMKIDDTYMVAVSTVASSVTNTTTLLAASSMHGYNIATGALLWSTPAQYGPATYAFYYVKDMQMIYSIVGNSTGRGGTQNTGDMQAWSLTNPAQPPTLMWTYTGSEPVYGGGSFLYGDGKIFIGGPLPYLTAINATTGQIIWTIQLTGAPDYQGSYYNGIEYIGLLDNTFVAINGANGSIVWSYNPNDYGFWSSGVAAGYGMVYELNVDGYLYAFNATTGNVIWKYLGPGQSYPGSVEIADGKVYACTGQATVSPIVGMGSSEYTCFNATTGQIIWQVPKEFESGPADYAAIAYGNFYNIDQELNNGTTVDSNVAGIWPAAQQFVLICYSSTPQDWNEYGQNPAHNAIGYGAPTNLTLTWKFQTNGPITSSPAVVAGKVYVGSYDHNIYCLDAYTGAEIWKFTTNYMVLSSPTVIGGYVYTGADDGNVYCLNATSGALVWKTPAPGQLLPITLGTYPQFDSSPVIINGQVFVGALDGKLYTLNAATGTIVRILQTTGAILSTPTYVANDGLYFASVDGFVYKIDPNTDNIIWNTSTPIGLEIAMEGSVCIGNGLAVIGSGGAKNTPAGIGQLYALNATTGKFVWVYSELAASGNLQPTWTPLYINVAPLGPVFYTNDFFDLVAINATNGKQIWLNYLTRESFCLPTYSSGYVYTGRMTNGIYVNNAASGQKVGFFNAGSEVASSIAIYNSRLYFGSYDHNIYCVGQSSNGTTYLGNPVTAPAPTQTPAPTPTPNLTTPTPSATPFMGTLYNAMDTVLGAAILMIIVLVIVILAVSAVIVREIKKTKKA